MAFRAQRPRELGEATERGLEGGESGELRADVDVEAHDLDAWEPGGANVDLARAAPSDAELGLRPARRDLVVAGGVDPGVDPDGDRGGGARSGGDFAQGLELGFGLHVELKDAGF